MIIDECQRFTNGRESRRPAGELITKSAFDIAPIESDAIAREFVATHHYAKHASPSAHRFGLYHHGELEGVALFGPPPSENAHAKVFPTLADEEAVTLGRLVLLDSVPGNAESYFIARCFELLAKPALYHPLDKHGNPRRPVAAIESCADPQPRLLPDGTKTHRGHLGIIYQATNGRYVGKTDANTMHLLPDGTCFSKRTMSKIRGNERGGAAAVAKLVSFGAESLDPNADRAERIAYVARWRAALCTKMRHHGNHRYLWCLDRRRRSEILTLPALAYPKDDGWARLGSAAK